MMLLLLLMMVLNFWYMSGVVCRYGNTASGIAPRKNGEAGASGANTSTLTVTF
jgi:hypothetical protein